MPKSPVRSKPLPPDRYALDEGWREFLSRFPWSHFLTISFREPQRAGKAMSVLSAVSKTIGRGWAPWHLFLATEPHRTGLLHLHGLMVERDADMNRRALWQVLFTRYGISRVDSIESIGGVTGYVIKYVTKGIGEWSWS